MRELERLPEPTRLCYQRDLEVGGRLLHKRSGREWTITKHWRVDKSVEVRGPGVNSPLTLTYDDIKRGWKIVHR